MKDALELVIDEVEMAFGVTTDAVEALAARVRELEAERDAALGSVADHVLIPRTTYNQIIQALTNCKDHKLPRVSVRRDQPQGKTIADVTAKMDAAMARKGRYD